MWKVKTHNPDIFEHFERKFHASHGNRETMFLLLVQGSPADHRKQFTAKSVYHKAIYRRAVHRKQFNDKIK
jgi:hypothetical protein